MSRTITGAAFREFYQNHWPKDFWHEDAEYEIEDELGKYILPDDAILEISRLGYLQGEGHKNVLSFEEAWDSYIGAKPDVDILTFRVPSEQVAALLAAAADLGLHPVGHSEDEAPRP